jgi:8-amino-7-oxononanoate synthase
MEAVIAPLVSRGDTVIIDRLVHESVLDAVRLGFGKMRRLKHDEVEPLRRNLEVVESTGVRLLRFHLGCPRLDN